MNKETVILTASVKVSDWDLCLDFMKSNYELDPTDIKISDTFRQLRQEYQQDEGCQHPDHRGIAYLYLSNLSLASFFKLAYGKRMNFNAEMGI